MAVTTVKVADHMVVVTQAYNVTPTDKGGTCDLQVSQHTSMTGANYVTLTTDVHDKGGMAVSPPGGDYLEAILEMSNDLSNWSPATKDTGSPQRIWDTIQYVDKYKDIGMAYVRVSFRLNNDAASKVDPTSQAVISCTLVTSEQ